jgi:hypothetical protein
MTPSGIDPATFQFAAQYLNHCATMCPIGQHCRNIKLHSQLFSVGSHSTMTLKFHVLYILPTWLQTARKAVHAWLRVHHAHRNSKNYKQRTLFSRLHFIWTVTAATNIKETMFQPNRLQYELLHELNAFLALLLNMCVNKNFKAPIHNLFTVFMIN